MARILITDDDQSILRILHSILTRSGHEVATFVDGQQALEAVQNARFDLMLTDVYMKPMDGFELLDKMSRIQPDLPVILMTGMGSVATALQALKSGVFDYIPKPLNLDALMEIIGRALEYRQVMLNGSSFNAGQSPLPGCKNLVVCSENMKAICRTLEQVAPTDAPVLFVGEYGVGKEILAASLHARSRRKNVPLVLVRCIVRPESFIDYQLMGVTKDDQACMQSLVKGLLQAADGGTVCVLDIEHLPADGQALLLDVMQSKHMDDPFTGKTYRVDARILATSSETRVAQPDSTCLVKPLIDRFSAFAITLAPLRERREEILPLAYFFLRGQGPKDSPAPTLTHELQKLLEAYTWPGNVEELKETVDYMLAQKKGMEVGPESLPPLILASVGTPAQKTEAQRRLDRYRAQSLRAYLLKQRPKETT